MPNVQNPAQILRDSRTTIREDMNIYSWANYIQRYSSALSHLFFTVFAESCEGQLRQKVATLSATSRGNFLNPRL